MSSKQVIKMHSLSPQKSLQVPTQQSSADSLLTYLQPVTDNYVKSTKRKNNLKLMY